MRLFLSLFASMVVYASVASANIYDVQWINKCILDNTTDGQTTATVKSYCECMNNLMPEGEERSITQWEKTHRAEEESCARQAGWVGR